MNYLLFIKNTIRCLCLLLLLFLFQNIGCKSPPKDKSSEKLFVAVAANMQFAMQEIKKSFEEVTGTPLELSISSSGKLTTQILQGAPYDVFISADMKYPDLLFAKKFTEASPRVYALGALVLWTCKDIDLSQGVDILKNSNIQKIAIANPATAPYGVQTLRLLKYFNLYDGVQNKLVYGESIAQTNQYIISGTCELGFTAKSVVLAPKLKNKGKWIEMDAAVYEPIRQGVVVTKYGLEHHPDTSRQLMNFLFSEKGQQILQKFGYQLPTKNAERDE